MKFPQNENSLYVMMHFPTIIPKLVGLKTIGGQWGKAQDLDLKQKRKAMLETYPLASYGSGADFKHDKYPENTAKDIRFLITLQYVRLFLWLLFSITMGQSCTLCDPTVLFLWELVMVSKVAEDSLKYFITRF